MMRLPLILWWSVVIGWLVAQRVGAQPGQGPAAQDWPPSAKGLGRNFEEAKKDAVNDAAQKIAAVMRRHQPALKNWIPPAIYIEKNVLDGPAQPSEEVELVDQLKAKYWIFPLKAPVWDDLTALARRDQRSLRADARLGWAFQVFMALAAGLTIWAGYLRLDHWTEARYTPWFRAGAMLIAALAISGIWWLGEFLPF